MRMSVQQSHGECFRSTETMRAREKHNRTPKTRPLTHMDHETLGRSSMVRIMNIIARNLFVREIVLGGETRSDGDSEYIRAAAIDANIDHQTGPLAGILKNIVESCFQNVELLYEFVVFRVVTEGVDPQIPDAAARIGKRC